MTTALYRIALEFSEEVERFAPLTRPHRLVKQLDEVDLTAATLSVKAERFIGVVKRLTEGDGDRAAQRELADADARTIIARTKAWLDRTAPPEERAAAARLVIERGELFLAVLAKNVV